MINANITTNTTWGNAANPSPIVLAATIFVKNGATLTILPGTIVRGQPRQADVVPGETAGSPGALIVTQNGRINAVGTPNAPIIFTTAAIDNNQDGVPDDADGNPGFADPWVPGATYFDSDPLNHPPAPLDRNGFGNVQLWGSLVLLGNAPTNLANKCTGAVFGKCTVEGLTVPGYPAADCTYGGNLPHDNSGALKYVSLRFGGDEIGNSNELNGISLAAVGDGTSIDNLEIYVNFDDGIEWFGGTVGMKHAAVFFAGDDTFDLDEGYTGVNQFMFGVMPFFNENGGTAFGSASGDKGGEFDGDNYLPDLAAQNNNVTTRQRIDLGASNSQPSPLSAPAMFNMTLIGSTPTAPQDFTPTSPASTNRGIQFRNGAAGNVYNSIITNTGAETAIEIDAAATGAPGYDATNNVVAGTGVRATTAGVGTGLINVVCTTMSNGTAPAPADAETTAIADGDALNLVLGGTAGGANSVNNAAFAMVHRDQTFNPQGLGGANCPGPLCGKLDASLKPVKLDPRPTGFTATAGCVPPGGAGLDPVTYRGAFAGSAVTPLWTTGWTTLNRAGILAN